MLDIKILIDTLKQESFPLLRSIFIGFLFSSYDSLEAGIIVGSLWYCFLE